MPSPLGPAPSMVKKISVVALLGWPVDYLGDHKELNPARVLGRGLTAVLVGSDSITVGHIENPKSRQGFC